MTGILHIVLARKPTEDRTVRNCLKHGTGALNIDACRIRTGEILKGGSGGLLSNVRDSKMYPDDNGYEQSSFGRWPANVIHDGSENVMKGFPNTVCSNSGIPARKGTSKIYAGNAFSLFDSKTKQTGTMEYGDAGSAGRYFFEVKEFKVKEGKQDDDDRRDEESGL